MPDTEERFDFSDVSPEEAGAPPPGEDEGRTLAEREAALESEGLDRLSEKIKGLHLERAGNPEEAAEIVKHEVEAERGEAVRETNAQTMRVENRYDATVTPQEKQEMEELLSRYNALSDAYEKLAEQVAKEGEIEADAYKKALKTGRMPEMTSAGKELNAVFRELNSVRARIGAVERRPQSERPPKEAEKPNEERPRTEPPPPPGGEGRAEWLRTQGREEEEDAELQRQTLKKLEEEHGPAEEPKEEVVDLTEDMKKSRPETPREPQPETIDWTEVEDWQEGLKKKEEFEKLAKEKGFIDWTEVGEPEDASQDAETPPAYARLKRAKDTVPNVVPQRIRQIQAETEIPAQETAERPPETEDASPEHEPAPAAAVVQAQEKIEAMQSAMRQRTSMERAARRMMTKAGGAEQAAGILNVGLSQLEDVSNGEEAREAIMTLGLLPESIVRELPDDEAERFASEASAHAQGILDTITETREKDRRPAKYIDKEVYDEKGRLRKAEKKAKTPKTGHEPEAPSSDDEKPRESEEPEAPELSPAIDGLVETMDENLEIMAETGLELPRKIKAQRLLKMLTETDLITAEEGKAILSDAGSKARLMEAYEKHVKKRNKDVS